MKRKIILIILIALNYSCFSQYVDNENQSDYSYNQALIDNAIDSLKEINTVHSLLIYKNDSLISETYFNENNQKSTGNLKSASKSILSSLIGIAIDNGFIKDTNQVISDYLSEYFNDSDEDWRKNIKIKDLLTMSSGLESTSGQFYFDWIASSNWIEYALNEKQVSLPGEKFHYSTGDTHLLSAILTKATGMTTMEFAQKYLFDKMNIEISYWEQDPQGYYFGGNNLFLTPRELGAFGLMYLNSGFYNNQQIVPVDWIQESTSLKMDFPKSYPISHNIKILGYGYLWWLFNLSEYDAICAWGFGGQFLVIVKELDLIIVLTQDWQEDNFDRHIALEKIIDNIIIAFS